MHCNRFHQNVAKLQETFLMFNAEDAQNLIMCYAKDAELYKTWLSDLGFISNIISSFDIIKLLSHRLATITALKYILTGCWWCNIPCLVGWLVGNNNDDNIATLDCTLTVQSWLEIRNTVQLYMLLHHPGQW